MLTGLLPGPALGREAGVAVHGGEHLGQGHDVPARQEWPERLGVRLVVLGRGRGNGEAVASGAAEERVGAIRDAPVGRRVLPVQRVIESGEPGEHAGRVGEIGETRPLDEGIALAGPALPIDQVVVERAVLGRALEVEGARLDGACDVGEQECLVKRDARARECTAQLAHR